MDPNAQKLLNDKTYEKRKQVKNGAELLDRLIRDIVSESAGSYATDETSPVDADAESTQEPTPELREKFSLANFIPLLKERIHVISPFTRTFLVSWLRLLNSIPDLELVHYLPEFLGGLFKFLSDPNKVVHTTTQELLETFLNEIKKIARIKKGIALAKLDQDVSKTKQSDVNSVDAESSQFPDDEVQGKTVATSDIDSDSEDTELSGDWIPGEDIEIDHAKILDILIDFVDASYDEEIQLTALRWIDNFFDISPEEFLQLTPRLLEKALPALASSSTNVRDAANRVNTALMQYIVMLPDESQRSSPPDENRNVLSVRLNSTSSKEPEERRTSAPSSAKQSQVPSPTFESLTKKQLASIDESRKQQQSPQQITEAPEPAHPLDYAAAVSSLTLQFLNENEGTRVAALTWLLMLHRKAPKKILAFNDGTFPALLKTLSDPSEAVVTRDLQLLSQISRNSEDKYFASFMVNLLELFSTDRMLLEKRGNLIIRQLCTSLSSERIYRTLADCLEKEDVRNLFLVFCYNSKLTISQDMEFASIMIQNLNNNLITAPELADLRKRLRNLETKVCVKPSFKEARKGNATGAFSYDRPIPSRLSKVRDNEQPVIRWTELLDKFRATQERWRRWKERSSPYLLTLGEGERFASDRGSERLAEASLAGQALSVDEKGKTTPELTKGGAHSPAGRVAGIEGAASKTTAAKGRSPLGNLSRLGIGQRRPKR
ncbi:hypothetical protein KEM55_001878 [Ascosphaera atra]|nr:hypothetical protein KEM55_001878 [Ascosphaera atra]